MVKVKYAMILFLFVFSGCNFSNSFIKTSGPNEITQTPRCTNDYSSKVCAPVRNFFYVIGKGAAPNDENLTEVQRYLLAERAAVIDGYRKLSEKLQGFIISALTKSGNFVVNTDIVKVQTESLIKGAEIMEIQHNDNGICTAKIKIEIPNKEKLISVYNTYSKM